MGGKLGGTWGEVGGTWGEVKRGRCLTSPYLNPLICITKVWVGGRGEEGEGV